MAGFITTGEEWTFSFDDVPNKPELPDGPNMATNYLAGAGKWQNYNDFILYEAECLLRKFFESKKDDPQWISSSTYYRRYTTGMMFEVLYGKEYDPKSDFKVAFRLAKLMAYYSTRITKEGSVRGKRYKKSIYCLSIARYKKIPPYSLRLRLEWLESKGELPTWHNMKLPKDDLKPGHARNSRTEENMRIRSERAKKRYNERYSGRKH